MAINGDFIGFSFNGQHSSTLNIMRVSDGSRYSEDLMPTFSDKTTQVPGVNETYYFYTNFTQKTFNVEYVFDELTELQMRTLRQTFAANVQGELIFDECPYKYWMAKVTGQPTLKYICFDEKPGRIYKGEGTITFTSYYPFARSVHKYLNEYSNLNKDEWKAASRMKKEKGNYDGTGSTVTVYNAGDTPTDLKIYTVAAGDFTISLNGNSKMIISGFSLSSGDTGICIDSRDQLIKGYNSNGFTTNLYNQYITSGDFFKLPNSSDDQTISLSNSKTISKVEYDYLYY